MSHFSFSEIPVSAYIAPAPVDASQTSPVNAPDNASVNAPDNVSVNAPDNASVNAPDNVSVNAPDNASVNAPDNALDNALDNAPVNAPDNVSVNAPDNALDNAPVNAPDNTLADVPNNMPVDVPDDEPEYLHTYCNTCVHNLLQNYFIRRPDNCIIVGCLVFAIMLCAIFNTSVPPALSVNIVTIPTSDDIAECTKQCSGSLTASIKTLYNLGIPCNYIKSVDNIFIEIYGNRTTINCAEYCSARGWVVA